MCVGGGTARRARGDGHGRDLGRPHGLSHAVPSEEGRDVGEGALTIWRVVGSEVRFELGRSMMAYAYRFKEISTEIEKKWPAAHWHLTTWWMPDYRLIGAGTADYSHLDSDPRVFGGKYHLIVMNLCPFHSR